MSDIKPKFSLSDLIAKSADLELLHPVTSEPTGLVLKVVGQDSAQFRASVKKLAVLKQSMDAKKNLDIDQAMTAKYEMVAGFITGWNDDDAMGGAYTTEYALAIVSNPGWGWLLEQVEGFASVRNNFLPGRTA